MQLNKLMWSKYKTIMNYSNNHILWYIIIYDHILWCIIILCYHILSYIIILCCHILIYYYIDSLSSIGLWDLASWIRLLRSPFGGFPAQAAGLPHNEIAAQVVWPHGRRVWPCWMDTLQGTDTWDPPGKRKIILKRPPGFPGGYSSNWAWTYFGGHFLWRQKLHLPGFYAEKNLLSNRTADRCADKHP